MHLRNARRLLCQVAKQAAVVLLLCAAAACGSGGGLRWNSQLYRVQAGETLYAIAWRYDLDYRDLARWNGVAAPYTIHPGQELTLTDPALLPESRQLAASSNNPSVVNGRRPPRIAAGVETKAALPPPSKWIWPSRGHVVQTFQGQQSIAQGIDIAGIAGQDVWASADGKVVYSGNGLAGFGQLIIIKHNDTYISAYGYNRNLLVAEGAEVKAGQKIAEMGKLQGSARLHFEIRRQGKPVDPLKYLPKP